jgi:hypothetical protein
VKANNLRVYRVGEWPHRGGRAVCFDNFIGGGLDRFILLANGKSSRDAKANVTINTPPALNLRPMDMGAAVRSATVNPVPGWVKMRRVLDKK